MTRLYAYAIGALVLTYAAIAAVGWVHHYGAARYDAGVTAGRNAVLADDARAAAQAQQARDALTRYASAAGTRLQHTLGTALPIIEGNTHASVDRIRTIYRDRPATDAGCRRPDRVQAEHDAAVDAANAAATGSDLRSHPATATTAARAAAAIRR